MSGHSKFPRASALQLLGALSLLFLTLDAQALTVSPSPSYDGNYVVSWSTTLGCTVEDYYPFYPEHCYSLQENGVDIPASGYSKSVTGKPAGSYQYRVYYRMSVYGQPYDEYAVEGPESVTVGTPPPRDPVTTQLTYQYETRTGDINWDGKTDIFVRRTSGGVAGNGTLEQVILRQNSSGGTFSILVPNSSQAATASAWPTSSASVVVTDFNVDGFVDVEVKSVAAAVGVAGAFDQIVFSPAAFLQAQPLGLRAVDASLKQFVGNALDYFQDSAYFVDNATLSWFEGTYEYYYCSWLPGYGGGVIEGNNYSGTWDCYGGMQPYYGYHEDYTGFSAPGVAIWTMEEGYRTGAVSDAISTEQAQEAAEEVLGVEIGGWPMEEVLGPTGEHTNPNVRRGLETFWAILGAARANAQEVQTDEAPPQTARFFNQVYITGHRVLGIFGTHTALEFTSEILPSTTISAGLAGGLLVSQINRPSDRHNMTVGTVNDPGNPVAAAYFAELLAADENYDDNLIYVATPDPFEPNTYNSNGYTRGLVLATGGETTVDWSSFPGAYRPVPAAAFQ